MNVHAEAAYSPTENHPPCAHVHLIPVAMLSEGLQSKTTNVEHSILLLKNTICTNTYPSL